MKYRMLYSNYDQQDKFSYVLIRTKYGDFCGAARMHPEDEAYESSFFGCQIAEIKALIKAHRAKIKEIKIKIKALKDFEKVLQNLKDYNLNSVECKKLRKQIYILNKEMQEIEENIQNAKARIRSAEETRKSFIHKCTKLDKVK